MSGDVQPRKRKDKKRKRDSLDRKSEGELIFSRKSSLQSEEEEIIHHGVHATKMGTDDVHLHVQSEHGTGGNWCAKIFFFSLMAILIGLVGLIIMENRGLSDLDTPLQESRFSEYFEGWVDEHREEHHDDHNIVAHEIEEHDLHDEPFDEVEASDGYGVDDEDEQDEAHNTEEDDHEDEDEEDNKTTEDSGIAADDNDADQDDDTAEETANDNDDLNDEDSIEDNYNKIKRETQFSKSPEPSKNQKQEEDDDDDENELNDNKNDDDDDDDNQTNKDDDPFDEEEYDGTIESLEENIVDNDAEELRLLQKKADQAAQNIATDSEEYSSTPRRDSIDETILFEQIQPIEEIKRSIDLLQSKEKEHLLDDDKDCYGDEDVETYSDNEYIEEEIEEIDEEEEVHELNEVQNLIKTKLDEEDQIYYPETFEQLNAMYRPIKTEPRIEKDPSLQVDVKLQTTKTIEFKPRYDENKNTEIFRPPSGNSDNLKRIAVQPSSSNRNSASTQRTDNSIEEKIIAAKLAASAAQPECLIESDEYAEDDDDILDEEELYEEEIEEEEEDEEGAELSDDGDDELMKRLEEKYGKLPVNFDSEEEEVEEEEEDSSWTKIKSLSGGAQSYESNDLEDEENLRRAEEHISQKNFKAGLKIYESLALKYPDCPVALFGKANALDNLATITGSVDILEQSIVAYQRLLALDELIPDEDFNMMSYYCINQMRSINHYHSAISIHMELIKRFDDDPKSRNELVMTYLYLDRFSDAKDILEENLKRWPNNGIALVNYGYILAYVYNDLKKGIHYLQLGIETDENGTQEHLFYTILGQSLLTLNREHEARVIFRKAVEKKLFVSEYQRPFIFTKGLKAQPFWTKEETNYTDLFNLCESNWRQIRDEALTILTKKGYFQNENEKLTVFGHWQEFNLISYGNKILKNCEKTPFTCTLIELFSVSRHCSRCHVKFSVIHPGTHVRAHCGPSNDRLRAHLGLIVPKGTRIRVAEEERTWEEGKFLIFDDSFEHEVWHNGSSLRLVLLVDVWHPQLTNEQKNVQAILHFKSGQGSRLE